MKKNKDLIIEFPEIYLKIAIAFLIICLVPLIAYSAFDYTKQWHTLQQIATDGGGVSTVDTNQNGFFDNSENCTGKDICIVNQLNISGGNPGIGKILSSDENGIAKWTEVGFPKNTVMFFNLLSCPSGWSRFNTLNGRYSVGLNNNTGISGTIPIGTNALTDNENRNVGMHNHAVSETITHSHTVTFNSGTWTFVSGTTFKDGNAYTKFYHYSYGQLLLAQAAGSGYVSTGFAGTVSGTNAPYVQLLACIKN